jgi:hypothetical protein
MDLLKIEKSLQHPGQIAVTVICETRVVDSAKKENIPQILGNANALTIMGIVLLNG